MDFFLVYIIRIITNRFSSRINLIQNNFSDGVVIVVCAVLRRVRGGMRVMSHAAGGAAEGAPARGVLRSPCLLTASPDGERGHLHRPHHTSPYCTENGYVIFCFIFMQSQLLSSFRFICAAVNAATENFTIILV